MDQLYRAEQDEKSFGAFARFLKKDVGRLQGVAFRKWLKEMSFQGDLRMKSEVYYTVYISLLFWF